MSEPQAFTLMGLTMAVLAGLLNLIVTSYEIPEDHYLAGPARMMSNVYLVMTVVGSIFACIGILWEKFL